MVKVAGRTNSLSPLLVAQLLLQGSWRRLSSLKPSSSRGSGRPFWLLSISVVRLWF